MNKKATGRFFKSIENKIKKANAPTGSFSIPTIFQMPMLQKSALPPGSNARLTRSSWRQYFV